MATSVKAIATVEVGAGGAASIEFTSIPADWSDLVVLASLRHESSNDDYGYFYFNSNTSNYSRRILYGTGSTAISSSFSNSAGLTINPANSTASTYANCLFYIPNYASSNNKSWSMDTVTENNATAANAMFQAGLWSNSSAITSITITGVSGDIAQYSTATLYGIKG